MPAQTSYAPDAGFNAMLSSISDPMERGLLSKINQNETEEKDYAKAKEKEIEAIKAPERPVMPVAPRQQDFETPPMQTFGSAGIMIATLGSLLTRQPLTNSLKGAAGVMDAVNRKDANAFKTAYDKWKTDTDYAFKLAEWDQNGFKDALSKGDLEAKYHAISTKNDAALSALSIKMQDNYLKDQEKARKQAQGGYDLITQHADAAYDKAISEGKTEDEALMAQMKAFGEAKAAMSGKNSEPLGKVDFSGLKPEDIVPGTNNTYADIKQKAEARHNGSTYAELGLSTRTTKNPQKDVVDQLRSELYPNDNVFKISQERIEKQKELAINATRTVPAKHAIREMDNLAQPMLTAVKNLDLSHYPDWNSLENAYNKKTGGTEVVKAYLAVQAYKTAYVGLLQKNGVATDQVRDISDATINTNFSLPQAEAVVSQSMIEGGAVIDALNGVKEDILGGNSGGEAPEGTVIHNGDVTKVKKGGKWVDQ